MFSPPRWPWGAECSFRYRWLQRQQILLHEQLLLAEAVAVLEGVLLLLLLLLISWEMAVTAAPDYNQHDNQTVYQDIYQNGSGVMLTAVIPSLGLARGW
jgi:hypothetical protein